MQADNKKVVRLLRTARGQLDGVLKMIEDDKYCIDIVNQIMASDAILHKAAKEIMHAHILGCVRQAFESEDPAEKTQKVDELIEVFDKLVK